MCLPALSVLLAVPLQLQNAIHPFYNAIWCRYLWIKFYLIFPLYNLYHPSFLMWGSAYVYILSEYHLLQQKLWCQFSTFSKVTLITVLHSSCCQLQICHIYNIDLSSLLYYVVPPFSQISVDSVVLTFCVMLHYCHS